MPASYVVLAGNRMSTVIAMHNLRGRGEKWIRIGRWLSVLACSLALGCGGGPTVYRISGNVTFAGKPIPVGRIYFTPDSSKGNIGLTGYADIKDGKYDSSVSGGRGIAGGATVVRIEGSDGVKIDEERPAGNALFPAYETSVELPKSSSTKDFDVPAAAATAQPDAGSKPAIVP
jgi:hypothetical protein